MTTSRNKRSFTVPVEISSRHLHVSREHLRILCGDDAILHRRREISQPGQFAAEETVDLVGPRGTIPAVRVVGPERERTQVELSETDARHLGLRPPLRNSGDLDGSAGVTLRGPAGSCTIDEGVIIQRRHIHAAPNDCAERWIAPGSTVRVRVGGPRGLVFENVLVKVHPSFAWRFHLDTDEANAAGLRGGEEAEVLE